MFCWEILADQVPTLTETLFPNGGGRIQVPDTLLILLPYLTGQNSFGSTKYTVSGTFNVVADLCIYNIFPPLTTPTGQIIVFAGSAGLAKSKRVRVCVCLSACGPGRSF